VEKVFEVEFDGAADQMEFVCSAFLRLTGGREFDIGWNWQCANELIGTDFTAQVHLEMETDVFSLL
jgi:hypothetical protein